MKPLLSIPEKEIDALSEVSLPSKAPPRWGSEHCFRECSCVAAMSDSLLRRWRYSWYRRKAKMLNCNDVSRDIKQLHAGQCWFTACFLIYIVSLFRTIKYRYTFYTYMHSYIQNLLIKTAVSAEELSSIHQRMLTWISGINQAELFLILNFRRVLNVVCFLLGCSPASVV
jgi:hypothetical protein